MKRVRRCSAHNDNKNPLVGIGIGVVTACVMGLTALDADATRIEYYATVGEPFCEYNYVHYTARFADGIVFDSSYKRLDLSPCALVWARWEMQTADSSALSIWP
ncbi:hypothetical protein JHK87_013229 [Glycine soja]|nr:hypothetical protein JHK87_013229 [Glycine soja]